MFVRTAGPVIKIVGGRFEIQDDRLVQIDVDIAGVGGRQAQFAGIAGKGFAAHPSQRIDSHDDVAGDRILDFGEAFGGEAQFGHLLHRKRELAELAGEEQFAVLETGDLAGEPVGPVGEQHHVLFVGLHAAGGVRVPVPIGGHHVGHPDHRVSICGKNPKPPPLPA